MLRLLPATLAIAGLLLSAPALAAGGGAKPKDSGGDHGGDSKGGGSSTGTENRGGGITHDGSAGARLEGAYVAIAPIVVTVFSKDGVAGRISAALTLEMADEAQAAAAAASHTRLRHALIQELHRLSELEVRRGQEYSIGQIKRRLAAVSGRILGEESVNDVLVQALTRTGG